MQKKLMSSIIYTLIMGLGVQGMAHAQQAPAANPTNASNQQANINYDSGTANLDGKKDVVLPPNGIPAPAVQNVGPTQPANGLPQDANVVTRAGSGNDGIDATIKILNTPSAKIREINRDLYNKGKVISESPVPPAKSANSVVVAHLSPGAVSPVVRVAKNKTTAIIITDMTGQPWPIINYDGLSEEDFTVKRLDNPSPDGYVLSVTPKGAFVSGNLTLILKGLPSPLNIDFVSAQKVFDAKSEIRVQGKGPNTQFTSIGLPDSLDTTLLSVLQGVAPAGSKELRVSSNAAQAWLTKDGSMFLRTRYKVMAPAFESVTSSPDGTFAYKMVPVPVVLYKAAEGRFGQLAIEGF